MLEITRSTERGSQNDPYLFYSIEIIGILEGYCKKGDLKVLDFGCGEQPFRKTIEKKIVFIILMICSKIQNLLLAF